jgi:DNA-binding response OmpR family regulator
MRVLIVEDNTTYARLVAERLTKSGVDADIASTVAEAHRATSQLEYSAIILDLGLPDRDGMEFLRELRNQGKTTPVVIVTARNSLADRVAGLRDEADDFLSKPFSTDELLARLHALLRRPAGQSDVITLGNVSIDLNPRQLKVSGALLPVRLREMAILELLIRHRGTVVTRRVIEGHLFVLPGDQESNAIDVYVHRLRRQLAEAGATTHIHTIRGVGFMVVEAKTEESPNEVCA